MEDLFPCTAARFIALRSSCEAAPGAIMNIDNQNSAIGKDDGPQQGRSAAVHV
jgi:hypothetical protein